MKERYGTIRKISNEQILQDVIYECKLTNSLSSTGYGTSRSMNKRNEMLMCLVYVLVSESFKLMCHHAKKKHKKHKKLRRGSAGNEKIQKRKKKEAADMAANGHKEKLITFMVKAFINIVILNIFFRQKSKTISSTHLSTIQCW